MIERAIGLLLLNAFWEPVLIAACAFAVLRIAPRASAATRCAVLTTAMIAALVLPVITTAMVYRGTPERIVTTGASTSVQREKPVRVAVPLPTQHSAEATSPIVQVRHPVFTVAQNAVLAFSRFGVQSHSCCLRAC